MNFAGAARSAGKAVVCGGFNTETNLFENRCFSFDDTSAPDYSWQPFPAMTTARSDFAFAQVSDSDFMVIGECAAS